MIRSPYNAVVKCPTPGPGFVTKSDQSSLLPPPFPVQGVVGHAIDRHIKNFMEHIKKIVIRETNLHPGLNHVNRCVPKHTGCPSNSSNTEGPEATNVLGVVTLLEVPLEVGVDEEPYGLI
jgi:hypothetical protein